MKTATIPAVRVAPELRAEVEAVLERDESLSQFVESAVRSTVERRRAQAEFVARGLRSRDEAHASSGHVEADVALAKLERKLEAARDALRAPRKRK